MDWQLPKRIRLRHQIDPTARSNGSHCHRKRRYILHTPSEPNNWTFIDLLGIDCIVTPQRDIALLSTYTDVVAISSDGSERWRRSVAIDGVEINKIEDGLIHGNAGIDPPDEWHPFLLQLATGNDAEQSGERERD